ncbi:MAG: c-type cytochrome biogenesis protein CcmI [Pseudomonadota bacterium]
MTSFWVLCGLMIVGALGILLPRMIRGVKPPLDDAAVNARRSLESLEAAHRDGHLTEADYQQRRGEIAEQLLNVVEPEASETRSTATAIGLALLVPVAALAIYLQVGTPGAIDGSAAEPPPTPGNMPAMIQQLRDRLENNPQDVDGWFLLGRSLRSLNDFAGAADAYSEALRIVPDQPVLLVEYAEALAFLGDGPQLPAAARQALDRAMAQDPTLQKGLWLKGMDAFNRQQPAEAIRYWEALLAQLDPTSPEAQQIEQQLALVRESLGDAGATVGQAPASEPAAAASLVVDVSLAPELAAQVNPGDTLFVFARAHNGPPMPLAIQRLTAGQLPARVTLDSTMAMMPAMSLTDFPKVVVGARISKSGNATAQPGDLEALSSPVDNNQAEPVELQIATVL